MSTCKNCNAPTLDGADYCEDCLKEINEKAGESYLDDLLSQVMSSEPEHSISNETVPRKQANIKKVDSTKEYITNVEDNSSKINDFIQSKESEIAQDSNDQPNAIGQEKQRITAVTDAEKAFDDALLRDSESVSFDEIKGTLSVQNKTDDMDDELHHLLGDLLQDIGPESGTDDIEYKDKQDDDILDLLDAMDDGGDILSMDDYEREELPVLNDPTNPLPDLYLDNLQIDDNADLLAFDGQSDALLEDDSLENQNDSDFEASLLGLLPQEDSFLDQQTDNGDMPLLVKTDEKPKAVHSSEKNKKKTKKTDNIAERKGFFARLFGNVKQNLSEAEVEELKQKAISSVNLKEEKQLQAKENKAKKKEEQKQKAAEKKAQNKIKSAEAAKKKAELKAEKERLKKEAKTKKELEIQNLIDEIDENEGRINRIGSTIVFLLFAAFAVFVVIGTNIYSYSLNIKNATYNFDLQRYNEAYKNVYGMEIKNEDIELYEKIMTVMFVNKQLNSYNHYSAMDKYPEALDSLLKGLERYDKYISLAKQLGIETDLDYVRSQIIQELLNVFELSEKEAVSIIHISDQAEYSIEVYNVVLERMETKVTQE